jgi:uncharacterized membrane protein
MTKNKSTKTKSASKKLNPQDELNDSKLWAILGFALPFIGFLLVFALKKEDKYALYYAKQGLAFFLLALIATIIDILFSWIIVVGWIIGTGLTIILIVLYIIGIINSLSGKEKSIPVVDLIADKIKV